MVSGCFVNDFTVLAADLNVNNGINILLLIETMQGSNFLDIFL